MSSKSQSEPSKSEKASVADSPDVELHLWYHGFLPRDEINRLLRVPGDFVLRQTEPKAGEGFQLVLSVRVEDRACHFMVMKSRDGKFYVANQRMFDSVVALVLHYQQSGEEINAKTRAVCINPIKRQSWELLRGQIKVNEVLGEGAFGTVHRGRLIRGNTSTPIAVKLSKTKSLDKEAINEISKEARMLRDYDHPNLVRFYGVSFETTPIAICMELASDGSLDKFLQKSKLGRKEKMRMCLDAARGLHYLHKRSCIHRDIAARNCLVAKGRVKISDFGLAQQLDKPNAKVEAKDNQKLPVRWTAPEALKTQTYSLKTDVYSFGVLMWEIYSNGETPYKNLKTLKEVFDAMNANELRLDRPKSMPEEVAKLMYSCLERDPAKRCTMQKVKNTLKELYAKNYGDDTSKSRHSQKSQKSKSKSHKLAKSSSRKPEKKR